MKANFSFSVFAALVIGQTNQMQAAKLPGLLACGYPHITPPQLVGNMRTGRRSVACEFCFFFQGRGSSRVEGDG